MKFIKELSKEISNKMIENSHNRECEETESQSSELDKIIVTTNEKNNERGLAKAEEKLEKINKKINKKCDDNDEDEIKDTDSNLPNLKYAKSKYKNVESVLKYVESEEEGKGVKLVIMNFND